MLLFASYLKNPGEPPVPNPAVWIEGNIIRYAGPRSQLPQEANFDTDQYEISDAALFPGLVNAHCHLELTACQDLQYPGDFVSWVRQMIGRQNKLDSEAQHKSLTKGILLSILGGCTTVADHISFSGDLETLLNSPLRGHAFIEVLGVVPEVASGILEAGKQLADSLKETGSNFEIHPSPHSVHALEPNVLKELCSQKHGLLSIHLGESEAEQEYFSKGTGPMRELIAERGSDVKHSGSSALMELENCGFLDQRVLAIHGNYFSQQEIELCEQKNISIVHCPLSHQYFAHLSFPWKAARQASVNLALGTDSLASAASLSMLEVLRASLKSYSELDPEEVFKMATLGGAKALQMENKIGQIVPGKMADLIGVSLRGTQDPLQALFQAGQVDFSVIDGKLIVG